jgi:hypothetical protein
MGKEYGRINARFMDLMRESRVKPSDPRNLKMYYERFKVVMAVTVTNTLFRDVTP